MSNLQKTVKNLLIFKYKFDSEGEYKFTKDLDENPNVFDLMIFVLVLSLACPFTLRKVSLFISDHFKAVSYSKISKNACLNLISLSLIVLTKES